MMTAMDGGPLRVVVADDSADDRALLRRELAREFPDLETVEVEDAAAFDAALERGDFDLVITDHHLGWTSGLSVFREVRARLPDVPVIMFTGTGSEEVAVEAMKAGLFDYVLKSPQRAVRLPVAVRAALDWAGSRRRMREVEERVRWQSDVLSQVGDAVIGVDDRERIVFWSRGAERLYGVSESDALGRPLREVNRYEWLHPEEEGRAMRALEAEGAWAGENVHHRADGTPIRVESTVNLIRDAAGRPSGMVAIIRDVTELRRIQEETSRTASLLQATLDATADGILVVDEHGQIAAFNRRFVEMWHVPEDVLMTRDNDAVLRAVLPRLSDPDGFLRGVDVPWSDRETRRLDEIEFTDGRILERYTAPQMLDGEFAGRVFSFRDVTEERARERELRASHADRARLLAGIVRAQEAERAEIAGDIHDDSIQAMTAVGLRLQTLRRHLLDDETARADFAKLEETVQAAITRLRRLLFELRPRTLDQEGVAAALRLYLQDLGEEAGIAASLDDRLTVEPSGEGRIVLYRIAQEALTNVRKHARASRVDVTLEQRDGGYLVRVVDDGVGFTAVDTLQDVPGHLGLPAMRERAEMSEGWLRVDSRPGAGTTVEFWLPEEPEGASTGG
jgi:PAS domain S-box-containing protein